MFARPIEPRERRTLVLAAIVSAIALVTAYGVVPFARHWVAREESIAGKREQLARLHWLAANEVRLTRSAEERERSLDASPRRLIVGESNSLATAELQRALQEQAEASRLQVQQVDVARSADSQIGDAEVAARLTAVGDVVGLAELLERITRGATLASVQELDVQPNPARGDLLMIHVAVRAPWVQP